LTAKHVGSDFNVNFIIITCAFVGVIIIKNISNNKQGEVYTGTDHEGPEKK
jgi:hypothetical protein